MYQEGKANMFSGASHRMIHGDRREQRESRGRGLAMSSLNAEASGLKV